MERGILSIDASSQPLRIVVARIDQGKVEIAEEHRLSLPFLFWTAHDSLTNAVDFSATELGASESLVDSTFSDSLHSELHQLKTAIERLETPWYDSVLIVPEEQYLSLNIDLPFNDPKQIRKVLELEVQDLVPFQVEDFLIDYRVVGAREDGRFDIHVGMIPKSSMRHILNVCKAAGFDPQLVSAPSGILGAPICLAPSYFPENAAFIWAHYPVFAIAFCINGNIVLDRMVKDIPPGLAETNGSFPSTVHHKRVLQELKLTLASVERRYEKKVEKVYVFGNSLERSALQNVLARPVEALETGEFVKLDGTDPHLAGLGAIYVETGQQEALTNFRCGEFAFRPHLRELFIGMRALAPYLSALLGFVLFTLIFLFQIRSSRISDLKQHINSTVKATLGESSVREGTELSVLESEISAVESRLQDIGSLSSLSVLDAFLETSQDFQKVKKLVSVDEIEIKENRITIKGAAPDYTAIDTVKNAFAAKPETY
ncbi:MAG: hypothetical protein KDD53_03050, partial [Bdellovibrionales bacterium]|nr:hypothetical protein [Bdellovibrionales bacterium]